MSILVLFLLFFSTTPTLISSSSSSSSSSSPSSLPKPITNNATSEFIRSSCSSTLYPNLCIKSLARYADAVQQDPVQLAHVAANLTFAHLRSLSAHISSLCRIPAATSTPHEASALHDCADALDDAVDQTRQSADEIGKLEGAVGSEIAWRVSNAQTWMSAALTNEDTCVDGFEEAGPGPLKADVCGRVRRARMYTSNALALVNSLVASR